MSRWTRPDQNARRECHCLGRHFRHTLEKNKRNLQRLGQSSCGALSLLQKGLQEHGQVGPGRGIASDSLEWTAWEEMGDEGGC